MAAISEPIAEPIAEPITAFDDPDAFNVKHPLANSWSLWYDGPSSKKTTQANWSANLKNLITVNTVEDFWGVYKNVAKVTELPLGSNYHFFKKGVKPEWEDPVNSNGGKWTFSASKSKIDELDTQWLNTLLAIIGEAFEDSDEICGAVLSLRKGADRISIWTKSTSKEPTIRVGKKLRQILHLPNGYNLGFQSHNASAHRTSSHPNDMYSLKD